MAIEMANVVAFQPFSSSKVQYGERWSSEALIEREELHVKLNLSRIRSEYWTVFSQSKFSMLINKFLVNLQKQWN